VEGGLVQRRWTVMVGGFAVACLIAGPTLSAPPAGKSVETETIIVPPDETDEGGVPDLSDPELLAPEGEEPGTGTIGPDIGTEGAEDSGPPPAIEYDVSKLPAPVRRIREQIIEAALTGDIEKLRPIIEANQEPPLVSFGGDDGDPVAHLKSLAGDPEGREILAILIEVLDAGYVHVDVGTPEEMYVWPYFARYPLDSLTGPQMVELFKLLTAGDYEDMKIYGTYLFYRVGIAPNGVWKFFVAGD
jgi:hypothetical protein